MQVLPETGGLTIGREAAEVQQLWGRRAARSS
jgi:hypothetical protein